MKNLKHLVIYLCCSHIFFHSSWARTLTQLEKIKNHLNQHTMEELLLHENSPIDLQVEEVSQVQKLLWQKYQHEQREESLRKTEMSDQKITDQSLSMRYLMSTIGEKPEKGYPLYIALHGGGGTSTWVNDSQWQDMSTYYKGSVRNGIYIAPRGITDTWDLHFRPESYKFYERIIENMILFAGVDPNRVYLLGFSAGGDGVYQIAPRLSDRLAAANMSAGHPNGVSLMNLLQLPFLIQVGEKDSAYNRNKVAAEYGLYLDQLQEDYPHGYRHQTFIHYDFHHNFYDNDQEGKLQPVIEDIGKWLIEEDRTFLSQNTNAISWVNQFERNPLPQHLIWDLQTRAERMAPSLWKMGKRGQQFYWLDIGPHTTESLGANKIEVKIMANENLIIVDQAQTYLKIHLTSRMVDFAKPLQVQVGGQNMKMMIRPNLKNMISSLVDRGDPHFMFEAHCILQQDAEGKWSLSI